MRNKVLALIYIILVVITIKLIYNVSLNSIVVSAYKEENYLDNEAKTMTIFNVSQSYIANYNYANILYQEGKYEEAIKEYKKALFYMIPKEKECSIRINYALANCKTVKLDEQDEESIKMAIEKYEEAVKILIKKGCANEYDNEGHSKEAQELKNDIQKEIDRLKNLKKPGEGSGEEENNDSDSQENEEEEIQNLEDKIQSIKEEATKVQREKEEQYKNFGRYDYNKNQKNW